MSLLPQPRARVEAMPEYHPPLADRALLRLDFNENTLAPSPRVMEKLRELTAEGLTVYPEREHAEAAAAMHFGLDPAQVLLTNGVDEAIHLLCCAFLEEHDEVVIATPTFSMYEVSASLMTEHVIRVQADESLVFPLENFLAAITPKTKLVMIASPNNPTGAIVRRDDLLAICAAAPQAIVFVDEAYFHFFGETTMPDVGRVKNLVVGRTFSKAYGLANLRLGLLAGCVEVMRYVRKAASPYNVNGIALACLPVALEDQAYLDWYVAQVHAGRTRVMAALEELGVRSFPSEANFVLFEIGARHKEFVAKMRERGILLRDRSSDPGCDGYVRITIGVEEHVTRGIDVLRKTLKEMQWTR
jgi:histidinol-phosphate aminotransferase